MKRKMTRTQPSSQINTNFFLHINDWISYITKSHFKSVEPFWTYLRIADEVSSYYGLSVHQHHSQSFFPNAERFISFLLQSIALRKEKKHWEQGWVGMHHCWVFKLNKNKQFSFGRKLGKQ